MFYSQSETTITNYPISLPYQKLATAFLLWCFCPKTVRLSTRLLSQRFIVLPSTPYAAALSVAPARPSVRPSAVCFLEIGKLYKLLI